MRRLAVIWCAAGVALVAAGVAAVAVLERWTWRKPQGWDQAGDCPDLIEYVNARWQ